MATIYADSTFTGSSDGSLAGPWKTIAAATLADGDTLALKRGSIFREEITSAELAFNNLTITAYGTGPLPIVTGAEIITSWADVDGRVYSYSPGSNVCGNVMEDNLPMVWRQWTTNLATTNLSPGEFTFDPTGFVLYIYPITATPDAHVYEVSVRLYCLRSNQPKSGLVIENIHFKQASRHGISIIDRTNWVIQNNLFTLHGGFKDPSEYLGNALEMSHSTDNGVGRNNIFNYTFDSAITTQLFESGADSISNHLWENNIIDFVALAGIEISTQTANQTITNVTCKGNRVTNAGLVGWMAKRTNVIPYGIGVVNNGGATCVISNVNITDNYIETKNYGVINVSTTVAGVNITCTRNKIVGPKIYSNSAIQGIRLNGGTMQIDNNYIEGFNTAIHTAGTATFTVTMQNNNFNKNGYVTYKANANSSFAATNNLFLYTNIAIHGADSAGGYTGNTNALWQNTANGGHYSSTGDITSDPKIRETTEPFSDSPLLTNGTVLSLRRDLHGRLKTKYIGAYSTTGVADERGVR